MSDLVPSLPMVGDRRTVRRINMIRRSNPRGLERITYGKGILLEPLSRFHRPLSSWKHWFPEVCGWRGIPFPILYIFSTLPTGSNCVNVINCSEASHPAGYTYIYFDLFTLSSCPALTLFLGIYLSGWCVYLIVMQPWIRAVSLIPGCVCCTDVQKRSNRKNPHTLAVFCGWVHNYFSFLFWGGGTQIAPWIGIGKK